MRTRRAERFLYRLRLSVSCHTARDDARLRLRHGTGRQHTNAGRTPTQLAGEIRARQLVNVVDRQAGANGSGMSGRGNANARRDECVLNRKHSIYPSR